MSLFAGVLFQDRRPVPDEWRARIARSLSRRTEDRPVERAAPGMFICFHDVGALPGDPLHQAADGSFTMLTGDPILAVPQRAPARTRADDVPLIHADLAHGAEHHLVACRGDFSALHYDPSRHRLALATDKSAIRPVLCYADEEKLVFCSSFRIFEAMRLPGLQIDPFAAGVALAGHAILGPLLPFKQSWRLHAGEVLSCEQGCIERRRYWRWGAIGPNHQPETQALARAAELLRESVRLRARGAQQARVLLSGGLDSRVVTACLLDDGVSVDACTLAPEGTADVGFARLYAKAAGIGLRENLIPREKAYFPDLTPYALGGFEWDGNTPLLLWSGFDGSFQLGHTFYYDPFIPAQRDGRVDEVAALFAEKKGYGWAASTRVLREPLAGAVADSLTVFLRRTLREMVPPDPGRTIYVYQTEIGNPPLMHKEYDDLDLHRAEYLIPLADFALIEHIMGIDPEICQRHRFYYRLLEYLPAGIKAVPWQSYPTQDPCPVRGEVFATTQWARTPDSLRAAHRRGAALIPTLLRGGLPGSVFKRLNVLGLCALHAIGMSSYGYHFARIVQLQRFIRMTGLPDRNVGIEDARRRRLGKGDSGGDQAIRRAA